LTDSWHTTNERGKSIEHRMSGGPPTYEVTVDTPHGPVTKKGIRSYDTPDVLGNRVRNEVASELRIEDTSLVTVREVTGS